MGTDNLKQIYFKIKHIFFCMLDAQIFIIYLKQD